MGEELDALRIKVVQAVRAGEKNMPLALKELRKKATRVDVEGHVKTALDTLPQRITEARASSCSVITVLEWAVPDDETTGSAAKAVAAIELLSILNVLPFVTARIEEAGPDPIRHSTCHRLVATIAGQPQ